MREEELRRAGLAARREAERATRELEEMRRVVARMAEEKARMEEEKEELKQATLCEICMDRPKNTILGCGHQLCEPCALSLRVCSQCRTPVTSRTRTYG